MNKIRKILRILFPYFFDYVEVYELRFVPEVNTKSLANMLKSVEFMFFIDNCEKKARYSKTAEEYKGVRFVTEEAQDIIKKILPKKEELPTESAMLRLDDAGLLEEARNGKRAN